MARSATTTSLAVIGAGPGGYAAAFLAADLGMQVTLIDPEPHPGGVCLYRGCIPSKALLHVARVVGEARDAARLGVRFPRPKIDLRRLRGFRDGVVERLTSGLGQLTARRGIEYVRGRARLISPESLEIDAPGGASRRLSFGDCIVATGSAPSPLPGIPAGAPGVLDSTSALDLARVPKRLLVVGGGYIGLELGSVYAALGSRVTVVELTGSLLPGVDADLVRPLTARLGTIFEEILLDTKVARCAPGGGALAVTLEGKGLAKPKRSFDAVLVAVGRRPGSAGLGLETAGVEIDRAGFVGVDAQRRASKRIFAIGDVAGPPMLAHKASHEGRTAVEAIAGRRVAFAPRAIPAVVFTDPEIAWCGLTEAGAKASGRKVEIARFPWAASGRAMTLDRPEGVTKMLIDPDTGRVLGVGVAGSGAGELIAEGVLAIEMAARAEDVRLTIHPHPTLSETLMESAEVFFGRSTHLYRPRRERGPAEGRPASAARGAAAGTPVPPGRRRS